MKREQEWYLTPKPDEHGWGQKYQILAKERINLRLAKPRFPLHFQMCRKLPGSGSK